MISEWYYVGAAYLLTWIVLGGYALHAARLARRALAEAAAAESGS